MYHQFFNFLGLREDPFHVSPDPRYFYTTPSHEAALAELLYGIEMRKGFMVLTGEAGTGKTSLLKQVLDWLKLRRRSTAYIFHTHVEPIGLLKLILHDFGISCHSRSKSELVSALHTWLLERHTAGDLPVLVLDEAQALPMQTLDELRLFLNLETPEGKLLQIILSGQPELEERLRLPELRQLRQRIVFHSRLELLSPKETAGYISRRLAVAGSPDSLLFPDEVVQDIYASSRGIPRVVNLLCEHALISAYAEKQHVVSPEMIQRVAADFDLVEQPLAVPESELQVQYGRSTRFPLIEEPETVERDSTRWLEQIEFDVSNAPLSTTYNWFQPKINESPAPQAAPEVVAEIPNPQELQVELPIAQNAANEIQGYWRGRRSLVDGFYRNCADFLRRVQNAVIRFFEASKTRLVELYESARPAAKDTAVPEMTAQPVIQTPAPVAPQAEIPIADKFASIRAYWANIRSGANRFYRNSIDFAQRSWQAAMLSFDTLKTRVVVYLKSAKPAAKDAPAPQVISKASLESQKPVPRPLETPVGATSIKFQQYWNKQRIALLALAHKSSATLQRGWHSALDPVVSYARPVLQSFVRDCRSLLGLTTPPAPAVKVAVPAVTREEKHPHTETKVVAPVLHWFRQPMNTRRVSNHRAAAAAAGRKRA
jgi:type II secretory pathway predicted ATPase ExeA